MVSEATHSLTPTCPTCAAKLATEDELNARLADEALLPLTDDDARSAGEVVACPVAERFLADALFTYAVALTRSYGVIARARGPR